MQVLALTLVKCNVRPRAFLLVSTLYEDTDPENFQRGRGRGGVVTYLQFVHFPPKIEGKGKAHNGVKKTSFTQNCLTKEG